MGYFLGYRRGIQNARDPSGSNSFLRHKGENMPKTHSVMILANPDYYDYIHYLELSADGAVELTAGAGQFIHFSAKGKYRLDSAQGTLELFDLRQINPYREEVIKALPSQTNHFRTETGIFAMLQETPFQSNSPEEEPVIVFPERYVFEADPLNFAREGSKSNLYYITEARDLNISERIYFRSELRERITVADAKRKGLKLQSKAQQITTLVQNSSNRVSNGRTNL